MKSKYTYFVTFKTESLGLKQLEHSITIETDFKVRNEDSVSELIHCIKVKLSLSDMLMHNFILISETHEPERSDDKKEFLKELYELFTKYDAQFEQGSLSIESSLMMGNNEVIVVKSNAIDVNDIQDALLEL